MNITNSPLSSDKASAKASAIDLNLPVTCVTNISSSAAVPAAAVSAASISDAAVSAAAASESAA